MGNVVRWNEARKNEPRRERERERSVAIKSVRTAASARPKINAGGVDHAALMVIIFLLMVGVVMIFSAGYYNSAKYAAFNNDTFYFLKRQGLFATMGLCVMAFVSQINYKMWMRLSIPIYLVSNVLLIVVAMFAVATKGARRWIDLPVIGRFQPSEVSKIAIILLVAFIICKRRDLLKTWKGLIVAGTIVGVTVGLVALGGMSTAIIVAFIGFGMLFVASPHIWRFVVMGVGAAAALFSYIAFFSDSFRNERFMAWLDPFSYADGKGYQTIQSLFAIASGGLFGLGVGKSRQKSYLPEPHNDFIFSIICEELGIFGAALVIILFGILIWRGIRIAMNAVDVFGSMTATGIVLMIASQTLINIAVVTNTIPATGVTLPLISYGGTSLLVTMFLLGILLNISRYSKGTGG